MTYFQMSPSTNNSIQILLIDSDLVLIEQLPSLLHPLGYQVHTTSHFPQARELLEKYPIELVVLEFALEKDPNKENGFQFADWLRNSSPYSCIDLITTSAYYSSYNYRELSLLRYQALTYLDKPLVEEEWLQIFKNYEEGILEPQGDIYLAASPSTTPSGTPVHLDPSQFLLDPGEWVDRILKPILINDQEGDAQVLEELISTPSNPNAFPQTQTNLDHSSSTAIPQNQSNGQKLKPPIIPINEVAISIKTPISAFPSLESSMDARQVGENLSQSTPFPSFPPLSADPSCIIPNPFTSSPKKKPRPIASPQQAIQAYEAGYQALTQGFLSHAHIKFQYAVSLDPKPIYRLYEVWSLYQSSSQTPHLLYAIEEKFKRIIQSYPDLEEAYLFLGYFYVQESRSKEAFVLYQYALKQQPQFQKISEELLLLGIYTAH